MEEDFAVQIKNVSKDFVLPHERNNSIKSAFISPFKSAMHKNTSKQHALKDVSFDIKRGEFFGIVGRNGSGKSTLLKMIAGIYQPNKGSIKVSGKLVPFIELGVGFNPELTGRQNVYLNGALLGFSKKEVSAMYNDIVEFAELEKFMDQKLKNYSSGMQVRLAFSMAVRAKADVLLIDEVLAVGDADFQRKCFEYFTQLKNNHTTVVFVSHDMNAVREYCDRAMLIEKNEMVDIGDTDKISEKYMQLFMEDTFAGVEQVKGRKSRWGDQALVAEKVVMETGQREIKLVVKVKANKDFVRPIAGFRIRDVAGNEVTGTNTKLEKVKTPDVKKGQSFTVTWKMPNVLRDGKYTVDIALQYPDEITVSDWWNNAAELEVRKDRHLPYVVDPLIITKIDE